MKPTIVFSLCLLLTSVKVASACQPVYPFLAAIGLPVFTIRYFSYGLAIIMALAVMKGILIAKFQPINPVISVLLALLANVVSTIVGIAFCFFGAAPSALFFLLPISFVLALPVGALMVRYEEFVCIHNDSTIGTACALTLLGFISMVLFSISGIFVSDNLTVYWIIKIVATTSAIFVSILLTTAYEVVVITSVYDVIQGEQLSFFSSVLKANVLSILALSVVLASIVLPLRFQSPDWLFLGQ